MKEIKFNEEARKAIKTGIDELADAVKMTLGPRGRAVIIEKEYGVPQVTFDGVTVAKEINFKDKYKNLGANLIKQVAEKTNDIVGDGTTTSVVLAQAMINEGEELIQTKGFNVIKLAEELNNVSKIVIEKLEEQKEEIGNDIKKIEEVATLSSKDSNIGKLIATVMNKVGKDGVVTIEDSNVAESSFENVDGMKFDRGYISQYMITNQDKMESVLDNPYILVTDKKITSASEIYPILDKLLKSGKKDLVIIADDVESEALTTLIINRLRGIFNALAIKAPGYGDKKKKMLEDIAILVGAKLVSDDLGSKLETIEIEDLGDARRVITTKDSTTIVDGNGDVNEIENRISQLKAQLESTEGEYDKNSIKERLGKLTGGVSVIKVGAPTESAQKELKDRVEDAVNATRAAMEEGIVPGSGTALYNVYSYLNQSESSGDDIKDAAMKIICSALRAPSDMIVNNSGCDLVQNKSEDIWRGFNAITGKVVNLKEEGIIDPLKVVKTAFLNAISVVSNYLMLGCAIINVPEENKTNQS